MTERMSMSFAVVLALLGAAPASAQVPAQQATAASAILTLGIDEAVTRGLAEAPRLAEARARAEAADATIASREALRRPTVTATAGLLRTNHVDEFGIPQANGTTRVIFPDIPNNYRARAELAMPLFTSGRVGDLVASAEADRRAVDADRKVTTSDLTLEIETAYWTLALARERTAVLERALQRADTAVDDVRARFESGILPPNDVQSAQAQRARQRVQLIQARNDGAIAEADLARLIGAPVGQSIALATPVERPTPGAAEIAALPLSTLTGRATELRPERQALAERQVSLQSAADAAAAATRPQVGVLAAVEPARPNSRFVPRVDQWNTGWDLGVNVTWALWDGGRSRADRAAAIAQSTALRERSADFDALVGVEVQKRLLDLASAREALVASNEAVDAAAEARRVLGERFAAGVATNSDVLDADVAWLEAELERTRLTVSLRLGEARLLRSVGQR